MRKVLFVGYGYTEPSSRYRAEQIVNYAQKEYGYKWDYFKIQSKNSTLIMIFRKFISLFISLRYDVVFLQRNPINFFSPFYELTLVYIFRKKVIFDFDDALWLISGRSNWAIKHIISNVNHTIVGNEELKNYARLYSKNVSIVNTLVDIDGTTYMEFKESGPINILWTGSKPSNQYIESIEEGLKMAKDALGDKIQYCFISDIKPKFKSFDDFKFIEWSEKNEKKWLKKSSIGLMPLSNTQIAKSKCGFKLILYAAHSLALITSPIAINKRIVVQGINGIWADSDSDWFKALCELTKKNDLLNEYRLNAYRHMSTNYSVESQFPKLINIIDNV